MRGLFLLSMGLMLSAPGCTHLHLRRTTVNQASTLSDLQYNMVLENLAMFAAKPASLPWHVNITGGTAQVTDLRQGQMLLGEGGASGFSGTRSIVEQWGLDPVTDSDELRLLRFAYRRALGAPEMPDPDFLDDLAHKIKLQIINTEDLRTQSLLFYQSTYSQYKKSFPSLMHGIEATVGDEDIYEPEAAPPGPAGSGQESPLAREVIREVEEVVEALRDIPAGWFRVGGKHDVPKDACYVAHHGDCYVWVDPPGLEGLTQFTLTVMDLATTLQEPQLFGSAGGGVSYSPGFE